MHRTVVVTAVVLAVVIPVYATAPPALAQTAIRVRSLAEAISLALDRSPALHAAAARVGGSRGERLQAGLLPNPELSFEAENVGGTGTYRGWRSAEITYGLSQKFELGGKRAARVGVAEAGLSIAGEEYQTARLDLVRDVSRAYAEVAAATRAVELENERAGLARELLRVAQDRVEAGKEPLIQRRKAEVGVSTAEISLAKSRRELSSANRELARLLGLDHVEVALDRPWFTDIGSRPEGPLDRTRLQSLPEYRRLDAELARSRAELRLEQAKAYPDVTLAAGVRQLRETDDTAFVVGLSVPVPGFDRNQGARVKAQQVIARLEAENRHARLSLEANLLDGGAKLEAAWWEADVLRRVTIPTAEQAFAFAREGYAAGKFPFLEVLDAQRALFEARVQLNDALREVHLRRADVTRLTHAGVPGEPEAADDP